MNSKIYLRGFEKELSTAAEMAGIDIEDAEGLIDAYFKALDYMIDDERMPSIPIHSLGTLRFDDRRVRSILRDKAGIKLKEINRLKYQKQLDLISKRTEKEKNGENGVGFWWSFVPKDFVTQLIKKENEEK